MRKEFMAVFTAYVKELEKKADSQMYTCDKLAGNIDATVDILADVPDNMMEKYNKEQAVLDELLAQLHEIWVKYPDTVSEDWAELFEEWANESPYPDEVVSESAMDFTRVAEYSKFDHYEKSGDFAVRTYSKYGDGVAVFYCDTLEAAKIIRTVWGKSIGLEPEPTYKDFALYPTIWEWQAPDCTWSNPCEPDAYRRLIGY